MKKAILMMSILLLTNCRRENFNCFSLQNYTIEEQQKLSEIIQKENNIILNKFIIDYYNLRENVKGNCNELLF